MRFFENLLVTAARRAAYMEDKNLISLPAGTDGEDEVAQFCSDLANGYLSQSSESFDEYIEKRLLEKYKVEERPAPAASDEDPKRITLKVSGHLIEPLDDLTLRERLAWEAEFGEHGKCYILDADVGEGFLVIPKSAPGEDTDGNLDGAWLWYDAASIIDYLSMTSPDSITPDTLRSFISMPELMTDQVCKEMLEALKKIK